MPTWVNSNEQTTLVVPYWKKIKLKTEIGDLPSLLLGALNESTQRLQMFVIPNMKNVADTALGEAFRIYGFPTEGYKDWLDAGEWISDKALHPLHLAADKELKKWIKTLYIPMGGSFQKTHSVQLKLPKGVIQVRNGVSYEGYTKRFLKAHSFDAIVKVTEDAIKLCRAAWNWEPQNLRVLTHSEGRAMGIAYAPGKGVHRISLHSRLVNEYDTMSIFRVILHELCHHYREERFPRSRQMSSAFSHDKTFCEALALVDYTVKDSPSQCEFFSDEKWEGSVVVQSKQTALRGDRYDPSRGAFILRLLKTGHMRMDWQGRDFNKKAIRVDSTLVKLNEGMTREQQERIMVYAADRRALWALETIVKGQADKGVDYYSFMAGLERSYGIKGLVK